MFKDCPHSHRPDIILNPSRTLSAVGLGHRELARAQAQAPRALQVAPFTRNERKRRPSVTGSAQAATCRR